MRWGVLLGGLVLASGGLATAPAGAQDPIDPTDVSVALLRQVCDLQWIDGVCEATGYPEPQYRTTEDPSPGQPLALRIGAVHEHSGYSDGDPDSRPADYFRAAKDGHNLHADGADTGVKVDYLLSSEHSDNEKLPVTTAAVCIDPSSIPDALAALDIEGVLPPLKCSNVDQGDHYRKWAETMAQALEATDHSTTAGYDGFTAMRGFEWTNDYYNHLGVYFSRNVVNAKIDLSYVSMDFLWAWLQEPATQGGGDDALVVFNHPGGYPALTPFDGGMPHGELLQQLRGGANWNDVAYVPAVDERVAGIEVHGGDDLGWYVRALTNGWHLGPVAAEDEHERKWSSSGEHKTLMLTRGRSPRDYYFALQHHRTIALHPDLVGGEPGQPAVYPSILYWAGPADIQDPAATVLGGSRSGAGVHPLHVDIAGVAPGSPVALVTSAASDPIVLGVADSTGALTRTHEVTADAEEQWWFAIVCPPGTTDCGRGEAHHAVTAPIWIAGGAPAAPTQPNPADPPVAEQAAGAPVAESALGAPAGSRLPATGGRGGPWVAATLGVAALAAAALGRRSRASLG